MAPALHNEVSQVAAQMPDKGPALHDGATPSQVTMQMPTNMPSTTTGTVVQGDHSTGQDGKTEGNMGTYEVLEAIAKDFNKRLDEAEELRRKTSTALAEVSHILIICSIILKDGSKLRGILQDLS